MLDCECPKCGKRLRVPGSPSEQLFDCPKCGKKLFVSAQRAGDWSPGESGQPPAEYRE